ncbi:unnamed protein product [Rhizoctonia solani]|uniref:BAG domain-containing protein n=1 Tax=Rhizoctonia solani TaxID=456999 RepID=A0A8H3HG59_9AGAM|nr:unnamed protein product [Rhizoctonia solani]
MFPFGRNPYAPTFGSYDPYEEMRLQQELQRRRQAEEYYRRRQLEELNRRRAEQLEYARRQAELQRRREAEARYRRQQELEARRRKFSEPSHGRIPRVRLQQLSEQGDGRRQSMFDGGVQDLFETIYGNHSHANVPSSYGKRSKSSDPRARQQRVNTTWSPAEGVSEPGDSAISDTEATEEVIAPPTLATESASHDATEMTETKAECSDPEANRSHSAISDILKSFSDLKTSFVFPEKLDFLNSPSDPDAVTPKLAYTPNNAPLHQYEHLLTGLLTKLDAVESYGQESIRKARKDAVRLIERELEELDIGKLREWRGQSKEIAAAGVSPAADVEVLDIAQELGSETQVKVDPASIPLPQDEDLESHSPTSTSSTTSPDSVATPTAQDSNLPSVLIKGEGRNAEMPQVNPDALISTIEDSARDSVGGAESRAKLGAGA